MLERHEVKVSRTVLRRGRASNRSSLFGAVGHECGQEMLLPVVNSPRVGVCGYVGCDFSPELVFITSDKWHKMRILSTFYYGKLAVYSGVPSGIIEKKFKDGCPDVFNEERLYTDQVWKSG